jgi:hypothetical protein
MLVDKGNKLGDGSSALIGTNPKGTLFFSLPKPKLQIHILVVFLCLINPNYKYVCIRVFLLGFLINPLYFLGIFVRFFCSIICRRKLWNIEGEKWMSGLGVLLER